MKQWYYAKNGQQNGPVSRSDIEFLYQKGELTPSDLVWEEGMTDWVAAGTVFTVNQAAQTTPAGTSALSEATPDAPLPDYGDFLCWGIAIVLIPCLGLAAFIALMVFQVIELLAVQAKVQNGSLNSTSYSQLHPVMMVLGLFCCSIICYPLFMHLRNNSGYFKPQPHAVWFSILIMVLNIAIALAINGASLMTQLAAQGHLHK